jgi:hypothetical protein
MIPTFDLWFCANCTSIMQIDLHGRCSVCFSEAVDIAVRPPKVHTPTVAELEKLYAENK